MQRCTSPRFLCQQQGEEVQLGPDCSGTVASPLAEAEVDELQCCTLVPNSQDKRHSINGVARMTSICSGSAT
eukprot:5723384-Amphidinium_carterae.1